MKLQLGLAIFLAGGLAAPCAASAGVSGINIREAGAGKGCWVLLHPFGMSGKIWDSRAIKIADAHQVRVYAPDLPDHGASALVDHFDYDAATKSIAAALASKCPRPAMIVGASSGGIVAMKLAALTRSRVAAIGVGWSFTPANVRQLQQFGEQSPAEQAKTLAPFAEQGDAQLRALAKSYSDLVALGTRRLFTRSELAALSGHLLILWGAKDDFFLRPSIDRLRASVTGEQFHVFPEAGHLGPLVEPDAAETWRLIDRFAGRPR